MRGCLTIGILFAIAGSIMAGPVYAEVERSAPEDLPAPSASVSESPSGTLPPSPSTSAKKLSNYEIYELQALLAETVYDQKKTLPALGDLLTFYEKMIGIKCMSRITSELTYSGNPTDPLCLELIDKTLRLHSNNPTALCARDGIDAKSCRNASESVTFGVYSVQANDGMSDEAVRANLDEKIASSKNAPAIEKLEIKLFELKSRRKSPGKEADALNAQIKKMYAKLLALTCFGARVRLAPFGSRTKKPEVTKNKLIEELAALPGGRATPTATATVKPPPNSYDPVRILEERCLAHIKDSTTYAPQFPPGICQRWGYHSPQCIDAKRVEARTNAAVKKADATPEPTVRGFISF